MTYMDVWSTVTLQERQIQSVEKLWKLNLIERSSGLALHVAYYRVSNSILKALFKTDLRSLTFPVRERK